VGSVCLVNRGVVLAVRGDPVGNECELQREVKNARITVGSHMGEKKMLFRCPTSLASLCELLFKSSLGQTREERLNRPFSAM
jgi:hypothetical protein